MLGCIATSSPEYLYGFMALGQDNNYVAGCGGQIS